MKFSLAGAHLLVAVLICCTPGFFVSAQNAVMKDGTVLTPKVPESIFATEGPIWGLDVANQGIFVTGIKVTIPETIGGTKFLISGSSVLGQDGEALTGIGAADFDRLVDANANVRDIDPSLVGATLGPRRLGAARSIFSTSEARLADPSSTQSDIEDRYFDMVTSCYAMHSTILPEDFLDRAGVKANVYPVTAGGTLKSAGHIYVDTANNENEYFVPDVEVVIELSENVAGGVVTSAARGDSTRPDSFAIGDLLLIMNQDPRFGSEVLGLGEAVIPRELFFDQVIAGETYVDVIGHMVGGHVLFVQEVLTDFINPDSAIQITADRFRIKVGGNEARWIGTVDKPAGLFLNAVMLRESAGGVLTQLRAPVRIPLSIDALTGFATYSARVRNADVSTLTHIRMEAADATTNEVKANELYDVRPFRE